jgi:hypothetical protein
MNELVEKLAKQATSSDGWLFDKDKFAELIIAKCVSILMKPEYAMNHSEELSDYNRGWVNGRLLGIEHIKEDFGVEE